MKKLLTLLLLFPLLAIGQQTGKKGRRFGRVDYNAKLLYLGRQITNKNQ